MDASLYSISSACATSAHCIGNAVEQIQLGKQDIVFAGGGEELCWEMACEPVMALVAEIAGLLSPNTSRIAASSFTSPTGVEVP